MQGNGSNGNSPDHRTFVTGEWTAEPSRNLLVRGAEQVRVEPRVMDVLVHLAGRAGEVVSKEDLVAAVWEGRYVTDDVLTVTVYALRKALGDDARQPHYIETVPRRGYRWIAPVRANGSMAGAERVARSRRKVTLFAVAAAALALVAGAASWLVTSSGRRHVPTAAAHEAYVKGRYFLDQRSISSLQQALEQFERAIAMDPEYPAAYAGLADTYSSMSDFGVATPAELRPRAMAAAEHGLQLDARSGEALAALGRAQFLFDWDFASAEKNIERAVKLNPEHMPAFQVLAWLRSAQGRNEAAATAARRALQLDPVNLARYTELAWVLSFGGKFDAALAQLDRALRLDPRHFECHMMRGWTYELAGKPDAAFAAYREGMAAAGAPKESLQRIDGVYRTEGLPGFYKLWLSRSSSGNRPLSDTWLAQIYVRTGELDRAIAALEQAFQKRESALAWVNVDPSFRLLHADVRFQRIASKVGHN
jgi:DNA-binding winged helix-turn-helix (wHTH) protein/Tfp pilus assembly protein PilF